jgi:hypothetical protein
MALHSNPFLWFSETVRKTWHENSVHVLGIGLAAVNADIGEG